MAERILFKMPTGLVFGRFLGTDDPGFEGFDFVHEPVELDDEVANDREVREQFDSDGVSVVGERRLAG